MGATIRLGEAHRHPRAHRHRRREESRAAGGRGSDSLSSRPRWIGDAACVALIAALTAVVGIANRAFVGFPKGYDAYGHMSKVKFLVETFPNADWNYEWYSGQFFSEGSFPPLFHYVAAALVGWFGLSPAESLTVVAATSFVVIACAIFGVVRIGGGNRLVGLIAALLLLSTNAFWAYVLVGGLYPRILGMAFVAAFALFAVLYFSRRTRLVYVAMVASLAAALSTHLLLGAIGVAVAVLMIAFQPAGAGRRLADAAALLIPTSLVVAYFYLPYALSLARPSPVPLLTREYATVSSISAINGAAIESLPVFLVPAALGAVAIGLFSGRHLSRLVPVTAIAGAGGLAYALVGVPAPGVFIYNFQPYQALFFAAWFLSALVGLALVGLRLPRWAEGVIALLLVTFVAVFPTRISNGVVEGDNTAKASLIGALHVDPSDRQHRVGVSWDTGSDWINARFDVPQTRGYQQQGVVNPDWQYWLETRLWSPDSNYDEKNFLLDWYAIESFYGGPDPRVAQTFAARPDLYAPQDSSGLTFDYRKPSQILAASDTRTALVIGDDAAYSDVFRALSLSDFGSALFIPVRGSNYLDDHPLAELKQFDTVILYGYKARDLSRSFSVLLDYVRGGGSVFIEANNSPLAASVSPPALIPGGSIHTANIGPDWGLVAQGDEMTTGVSIGAFAPASYNGGPWGISYIPQSEIDSWARPVLLSAGRPVLVAGTLGSGRVVWSGMNLPYHAASNRNRPESLLLGNELAWADPARHVSPSFRADFVNPELRRVKVTTPAEGVLLKESWVPNWQATVDGRAATIYRAGPDFMYVPLSRGAGSASVEFKFTRTPVEWLGGAISAVAVLGLIAWAVEPWIRRRRVRVG